MLCYYFPFDIVREILNLINHIQLISVVLKSYGHMCNLVRTFNVIENDHDSNAFSC